MRADASRRKDQEAEVNVKLRQLILNFGIGGAVRIAPRRTEPARLPTRLRPQQCAGSSAITQAREPLRAPDTERAWFRSGCTEVAPASLPRRRAARARTQHTAAAAAGGLHLLASCYCLYRPGGFHRGWRRNRLDAQAPDSPRYPPLHSRSSLHPNQRSPEGCQHRDPAAVHVRIARVHDLELEDLAREQVAHLDAGVHANTAIRHIVSGNDARPIQFGLQPLQVVLLAAEGATRLDGALQPFGVNAADGDHGLCHRWSSSRRLWFPAIRSKLGLMRTPTTPTLA